MLETYKTYMKLCVTELDFLGKKFYPKNCENGPKIDQKQGFLNLLKNLVINLYWICSIMKIYIICCFPAQISYLGEFLFLKYRPACSQTIIAGFFNQPYLQISVIAWFFACWYKFTSIKSWEWKWEWSKMSVASLVTGL